MASLITYKKGFINVMAGRLAFVEYPVLNLTADGMGAESLTLTFDDDFASFLDVATGNVVRPAPYIKATLSFSLVKTSPEIVQWQNQLLKTAYLGDGSFTPDTPNMDKITFGNATIFRMEAIDVGITPAVKFMVKCNIWPNKSLYGG